jgi:hypothetical protein
MDPSFFRLDYEQVFEVLVAIILLSMFIERALALLFESKPYIEHGKLGQKSKKEIISFVVSILVCWYFQFDALGTIFYKEEVT